MPHHLKVTQEVTRLESTVIEVLDRTAFFYDPATTDSMAIYVTKLPTGQLIYDCYLANLDRVSNHTIYEHGISLLPKSVQTDRDYLVKVITVEYQHLEERTETEFQRYYGKVLKQIVPSWALE